MRRPKDPSKPTQSETSPPEKPRAAIGDAHVVAVLVGMAVCLLAAGLIGRSEALFGMMAACRAVVAAVLMSLAMGPVIPYRLAIIGGAGRAGASNDFPSALDRSLLWTVLAVVALLSGLAVAALLAWAPLVESGYRWALVRFLWTGGSLDAVRLLAAVMLAAPALTLAGVTLSCACRLAYPPHQSGVSPLGWALVGAAMGLAPLGWSARLGLPADAVCLTAAVPLLLAAVVATRRLGRGEEAQPPMEGTAAGFAPDLRDRHPIQVRFTVVWLAVSTAAIVALGWGIMPGRAADGAAGGPAMPVLPSALAVGMGLIACERSVAWRSHSAAGLGVACAASGVGVALAASISALWPSLGSAGTIPRWVAGAGRLGAATLMGFALAYGHLALLRRVGDRVRAHASLLATTLAVWGAMAFLLIRPEVMGRHAFVLIAACAVSLVALGGVVVIHEPVDSPRTRRRRLVAVFVSVALLIGLLPAAGRQWSLQTDQRYRTARLSLGGSRWVAASAKPDSALVAP